MTATIFEDGRLLVGTTWITPADYAGDEVERGELLSLKGCTPGELPTLDDDQVDDERDYFSRNVPIHPRG